MTFLSLLLTFSALILASSFCMWIDFAGFSLFSSHTYSFIPLAEEKYKNKHEENGDVKTSPRVTYSNVLTLIHSSNFSIIFFTCRLMLISFFLHHLTSSPHFSTFFINIELWEKWNKNQWKSKLFQFVFPLFFYHLVVLINQTRRWGRGNQSLRSTIDRFNWNLSTFSAKRYFKDETVDISAHGKLMVVVRKVQEVNHRSSAWGHSIGERRESEGQFD